jgi:hypothetical protein
VSDERKYLKCRFCGLLFMPVVFLNYRMIGYCTEGCLAHEKRTKESNESIAHKNGFPLRGLKGRVNNEKT